MKNRNFVALQVLLLNLSFMTFRPWIKMRWCYKNGCKSERTLCVIRQLKSLPDRMTKAFLSSCSAVNLAYSSTTTSSSATKFRRRWCHLCSHSAWKGLELRVAFTKTRVACSSSVVSSRLSIFRRSRFFKDFRLASHIPPKCGTFCGINANSQPLFYASSFIRARNSRNWPLTPTKLVALSQWAVYGTLRRPTSLWIAIKMYWD